MTRSRLVVVSAAVIVGVGLAAAGGAVLLDPARAAVGPLPPEALVLPADASFVGGIDVKRFVASPFYVRFVKERAGRQDTFAQLEEKTGLNPERDLDQVYFAGTPGPAGRENGLAIVMGRFDRYALGRAIETEAKKGVTWKNVAGSTLYLFNEGERGSTALAFLDDHTLAIGPQPAVEAAANGRAEGGRTLLSNARIMALLERVKPGSTFWVVGDQSLLQNLPGHLAGPGSAQSVALPGLRSLTVVGDMDPLISVEATGEAADAAAAKNLADVVRGFVALATLQASQKPELKDLASAVSVTQDAARVQVNARIPYELLDALQKSAPHRAQPAGAATK
jgi:hypothetical protein